MSVTIRGRAGLKEWKEALALEEEGPYIGPRPQTSRDGERMLIGRSEDLERINRAVLARSLVVLDGYSGVGKSSLLQNGLYRRLEEAGFAVLVSRKWGVIPPLDEWTDAGIERYVAGRIQRTHDEGRLPLKRADNGDIPNLHDLSSGNLCDRLDVMYEESGAVLILDQFEELLRQNGKFAEKVVKWIINIGYRHSAHVIITIRTDSLHQLDPLLRGVKPFSMDRVRVGELEDEEAIKKVIETGRDENGRISSFKPELEAIEQLLTLWRERDHRVKLLDLQATLYVLYLRARQTDEEATDRARISADDVAKFVEDAKEAGLDPLTFGLHESMRLKIEHAEAAARKVGLDEYLIFGTREIVRRAAPFFSSGEFKVPMREIELVQRTLVRERQVLVTDKGGETILSQLRNPQATEADLLTVGWWEIATLRECDSAFASSIATQLPRHRGEVNAGPMMSTSPDATWLEEIRRVAFAIEWLECTEIIRKDDDGWLLLVHDGSGSALNAWANKHPSGPDQALRQLTAVRGEHYVWDQEIGGTAWTVIANLNWRECRISTRFRNVVFVNCDFSGSRFDTCTFQGVTFVNCLLDDANFEYCEIRGVVDQRRIQRKASGEKTRLAPSFTVEVTGDEARFFTPYLQGNESESDQFFSDTSGKPAVPGAPPENHQGEVIGHFAISSNAKGGRQNRQIEALPPTQGGVAMLGGRLCFLTLYRCRYEDGGSFAFRHVSGGGLDIVEQYGGRIDIHDGAIRGISITRDRDTRAGGTESKRQKVELTVNESVVANLYFSDGLAGSASFEDSRVMMLINAGENSADGFRVGFKNCRYQFLVNTDQPDGLEDSRVELDNSPNFTRVFGSESRFELLNREALAKDLEAMDYRSRPEAWEEEQRKYRVPATITPPKESF